MRQHLRITLVAALALAGTGFTAVAATRGTGVGIAVSSSPVRNPDVTYDAENGVFLAVTGNSVVQGQFVSPTGALLPGPFGGRFSFTTSTDYQHTPRAYCAEGVCLLTWHQGSPVTPMARVVSYKTGFVSAPVVIGPAKSAWEFGIAIAYSTVSGEFMATWMGDFPASNNIYFARINKSGQVLQSTALTTGTGYERQPSVAYNPSVDEFVIAYAGTRYINGVETGFVRTQRMKNGSPIGGAVEIHLGGPTYIPIAEYNPGTQSVLVGWVRGGGKVYGREVRGNGTIGSVAIISTSHGTYDALDIKHNKLSSTFLLVTHGSGSEDVAVEFTEALSPSPAFEVTSSGGSGNYNPRLATSTTEPKWLVAVSRSFSSLWVQFAHGTAATPPCTVALSASGASAPGDGGAGSFSLTTSATPCNWSAASSAGWLSVSPGSGTATATLNWTAQANASGSPRSAAITVGGQQFTVSQGVPGMAMQFDGTDDGDVMAYVPSTGAWSTYLGNGSTFTSGPSGSWHDGWRIQAARFNADGLTDYFYYNPTTGDWHKGLNTGGDLTFYTGSWATGWETTVIDLDGDGLTDVFLYNPASGAWQRCISSSESQFSCTVGAPTWAPGWKIFPAKFNNDAYGDLFLYNTAAGWAGLWFKVLGQADGSFAYVAGDLRWAADWQVTPGDFDADGLTDLLLYRTSDGQVFRVRFTDTSAIYTGSRWGTTWTIQKGDFNGDRRSDLLLYDATTGDGRWAVGISNAAGWFDFYYPLTGAGLGWAPHVAFLDGDNKSDILWYYPATGTTVAWYSTTPGSFNIVVGPTLPANAALLVAPYSVP